MLIIKSQNKDYGVSFPTSLADITPDVLKSITEHVKLQKHYCVVALCYKTNLFSFATQVVKGKGMDVAVTPLLAKINPSDDSFDWKVGDKVIIDRTGIEMAHHVTIPVAVSSQGSGDYITNDPELRKSLIDGSYFKDRGLDKNATIYILEFKIVALNNIVATVPCQYKSIDPFKVIM